MRRYANVAGLVLLGALCAVGPLAQPKKNQSNPGDQKKEPADAGQRLPDVVGQQPGMLHKTPDAQENHQSWLDEALRPQAVASWLMLAVTGLGVGAALNSLKKLQMQTEAAKLAADSSIRAANNAERALHLTERADLLVETLAIPPEPWRDTTTFAIVLRNYGRTRATGVTFEAVLVLLTGDRLPSEVPAFPTLVGAGDRLTIQFLPPPEEVIFIMPILHETLKFEVEVKYTDVFGFPHHTQWSAVYRRGLGNFVLERHQTD